MSAPTTAPSGLKAAVDVGFVAQQLTPARILDLRFSRSRQTAGHPLSPAWMAWAIGLIGVLGQIGLSWDSYAHWRLPLDSFFTPPHLVIYAAGFAGVSLLGLMALRNLVLGYPLRRSVPDGYELSLVGCVLFPIGGVADFIWHATLGFERVLPVWSPSHLLVFLAAALIMSGPLRHAWRSEDRRLGYGALLATGMLFLQLTFPLIYQHPFVDILASGPEQTGLTANVLEELGVAAILLQAAAYTGFLLFLLKRFQLPFGTVTFFLLAQAAFVWPLKFEVLPFPIALVAGLLADGLIYWLQPSPKRSLEFRTFAALFPMTLYLVYFVAILLTGGIWWKTHIWIGMLPGTAAVGWMLSYLVLPPASGRPDPTDSHRA